MFCNKCGAQLNDGAAFCPNCGQQISQQSNPQPAPQQPAPQQPAYQQPAYQQPAYQQPAPQPIYRPILNSTPILVFGILALAFASTFFASFMGIIFGPIAMSKCSAFLAQGGVYAGKAKVGKILGRVGLILGIVMTVLFIVYIIVMATATTTVYHYYY